MMKLSTMKALVQTLDDQGSSPIAEQILTCWEHDPGSGRFWRASSNFIFTYQTRGQGRILRFAHASERKPQAIQAEIDWIRHLISQGIPAARPVPSLAGQDVETVETSLGSYHTAAFERLSGEQYETADLSPEQFRSWGMALGRLHNAAQGYITPERLSWQSHLAWAETVLPESEHGARKALHWLKNKLEQLPVNASNFGLIHFDFETDNLFWNKGEVSAIDFDDCAYSWFTADIAYALRDLFDDHFSQVDLQHPSFLAFIEGYRVGRPIEVEEINRIPLFLLMSNLMKFAELRLTLEEEQDADEPAWMSRLRQRLAGMVDEYREEFTTFVSVLR